MYSGESGEGEAEGGLLEVFPKRVAERSQAEAGPLRPLPDRGAPLPWGEADESVDSLQERAGPLPPR